MNALFSLLFIGFSAFSLAQDSIVAEYHKAESLLEAGNFSEAHQIYRKIETQCDRNDTMYPSILWFYTVIVSELEKQEFAKTNWESSIIYALEALTVLEKGELYFDQAYTARKYWMYKDIIVAYSGLGQLDKASAYQDKLFEAYQNKTLPEGINRYYDYGEVLKITKK